MSVDNQRHVLRDIAGGLLCTVLDNERAEATKIYILLILSKTHADFLHECLYSHGDIFLGYTCLLGNFVDDFCFCHFSFAYILIM